MSRPLRILAFVSTFAALAACAASAKRWAAYPGCSAAQCQEWFEACRAECLNDKGSVTECDDRCREPMASCQSACGS
jgi:hypothetical protein